MRNPNISLIARVSRDTTVLLRNLPAWLLYQTALTRTTPEGLPASITYQKEPNEHDRRSASGQGTA